MFYGFAEDISPLDDAVSARSELGRLLGGDHAVQDRTARLPPGAAQLLVTSFLLTTAVLCFIVSILSDFIDILINRLTQCLTVRCPDRWLAGD